MIMKSGTQTKRGFTLAELLAVMVFMAIVIPVCVQGISIVNHASVRAHRQSIATELGHSQLQELLVTGDWQSASNQGNFGEAYPGYRWEIQTSTWNVEAMQLLQITVFYPVQNQEHFVQLVTLLEEEEEE